MNIHLRELAFIHQHGHGIERVALPGGVARMGELFTGRFRRALEHLVPQCVYQPAKYSPVVGAALCVLSESAGVDITAPGVAENLMKEKMGEAHVDG